VSDPPPPQPQPQSQGLPPQQRSSPDLVEDVFDHLHDDADDATETDDVAPPDQAVVDAAELDEQRIRQIATLRRATYRSRSYAIVAMVACVVVAVQLSLMSFSAFRRDNVPGTAAYLLFAASCVVGAIHFYRRAAALNIEAKQTRLDSPTGTPDFSTLRDGTQRLENLENLE